MTSIPLGNNVRHGFFRPLLRNVKMFLLFGLFTFLICTPVSQADEFIVNTGPGPASVPAWVIGEGDQWLAAEFVVDRPSTITSAKGWIWSSGPEPMEIAILSDGGEIPGVLLHSGIVTGSVFNLPAWTGLTGLSWHLEPGTYWISFGDVRSSLPGGSVSANAPYPSVNPLEKEAIWHPDGGWSATDTAGNPIDFNMGVQIIAASDDGNEPVCWQVNGHCYQNIAAPVITWNEARAAAENLFFRGVRGHLATITSQAEQDFINTMVMPPPEQQPAFGGTRGWIGGFQAADNAPFQWVTGELFDYTNWRVGEPRGDTNNNYIELNWELADWNDTANFDAAIDGFLVEYPLLTTQAQVSCPGDVNGDKVADIAVVVPHGQVWVKGLNGGLISQFVLSDIDTVVDVETMPNINANGSPELVALGTGSVQAEVWDTLTAAQLSLINFDPTLIPLDLELVDDQTGNNIPELANLAQGSVKVEVRDGLNGNLVNSVSFSNYIMPMDLEIYPDTNDNSAPELAVLGDNKDPAKGDKIEVRDLTSGSIVQNIWLGKGWQVLQQELMADHSGNGAEEVAVLRVRNNDDAVNVMVRDTKTRQRLGSIGFDRNYPPTHLLTLSDVNGNGADEVVVFGQRINGGNQKAQIKDSKTKALIRSVFFDKNFAGQDIATCADINGNGAEELVLLGKRASDGKLRAMVKDAKTGALIGTVNF